MILQKIFAYTYKEKPYFKYIITIPEEIIEKLGWKEGYELKHTLVDKFLVIEFQSMPIKRENKTIATKMSYNEFRDKIRDSLLYNDKGMTWTELRNKLKLEQIVPNNKWVRQMENEIGLIRTKEIRGIVWRIRHVH